MQVLVVSTSVPPFSESSTLQLVDRVRCLPDFGFEVVVVKPSSLPGVEKSLAARMPSKARYLETGPTLFDWSMARLSCLPAATIVRWIFSNLMYRLAVPDVRVGWNRQVLTTCRVHAGELRPDLILTSSGSYTAHMAGPALAGLFQAPWVADLGDPWSLLDKRKPVLSTRAKLNQRLELRSIPNASGVVFTTEETLAAYREWLGSALPRAVAIPTYGFDVRDFAGAPSGVCMDAENIHLSHIGAAFHGNRSLVPTIRAISALSAERRVKRKYTLNVIGPHSVRFEKEAERIGFESVFFCGVVSYSESIAWMKRSGVLLIVGNRGSLQIPGKVYPCLGSGRPILYLGQTPRRTDAAASLLERFSGVIYATNEVDSICAAIREIDERYEELFEEARERLSSPNIAEYTSPAVSERFAQFAYDVASSPVSRSLPS